MEFHLNKFLLTIFRCFTMRNCFLFLFGLLAFSCKNGTEKISQDNGMEKSLSDGQVKLVYDNIKTFPNSTEFSIAVINGDGTKYYGGRWKKDTIEHVDNSGHLFEVGSITKVFTATILASLVVEEKIKLKDPIQKYLDFDLRTDEEITFEQLANHTSGLSWIPSNLDLYENPKNPYKTYDQNKLKKYLTDSLELKSQPGRDYAYSNLGAALLGFIMTEITESTFEELLHDKIFKEYGMSNSTTNRAKMNGKIVPGLNPEGKEISDWDFLAIAPAIATISSVKDLVKFANVQFNSNDKTLVLTQQPTFNVSDQFKVGLGWHILDKNNRELIWHNGGTGGYSSSMALDLNKRQGVIVLSNVSTFHPQKGNIDQLCFALIETLEEND